MKTGYPMRVWVVLVFSIVAVSTVVAQTEHGADDITVRSMNLRLILERAHRRPTTEEKLKQALAELQEDFTRLQTLNLEFVRAINVPKLDYKFVSKSAGEINKRANRLKNNLDLPQPMESESPPARVTDELGMKKSMLRLGKLIYSFSHNPFFKEASVVNENAVQARRELNEIIELSKQIKIDSDLRKSSNN